MRPLNKIQFLAGYWLIWTGLFEAARAVFIVYNYKYRGAAEIPDLMTAFLSGLRMDISAATYIIAPCSLMMIPGAWMQAGKLKAMMKYYSYIVLIPVLLVILCDLPAYGAWGFRLDVTPLKYLKSPSEALASVSHLPVFTLLAATALAYYLLCRIFSLYINSKGSLLERDKNPTLSLLLILIFSGLLIIPARGGLQLAPLNQSSVYKSRHHFVNISSLNAPWNFIHSLGYGIQEDSNPFSNLPYSEAVSIRNSLFEEKGSLIRLIDSAKKRPNIILITWESFTYKALGLKRSEVPVVPHFEKMAREGLFFTDLYATGDRTEKGVLGILSGYPALPTVNMMRMAEKHNRLNTLPEVFSDYGYKSCFYYGGEIEFANMKSYLLEAGFSSIIDKNDFEERDLNSKWGAHDHVVASRIKSDLDSIKPPFFINWLTLSSHEPFETGMPEVIRGSDDESKFLNTLHYADSVIYDLIRYCQTKSWWDNTVIIIIGDHGHRMPATGKRADDFRTPMLWLGGALAEKGKINNSVMNQTDIASTLAGQLGMQSTFTWSKNMGRNNPNEWAYFTFKNGFGWVEPGKRLVYDNVGKRMIESEGMINNEILKKGFALQQLTYDDFLEIGDK